MVVQHFATGKCWRLQKFLTIDCQTSHPHCLPLGSWDRPVYHRDGNVDVVVLDCTRAVLELEATCALLELEEPRMVLVLVLVSEGTPIGSYSLKAKA